MAQFPAVQSEEVNAFPNSVAGSGDTIMGAILKGKFTQGAPPNLSVISVPNSAQSVTLTPATIFGMYIRNLSATASVQVTATPTGGSSAVIGVISPGGIFLVASPAAGSAPVTATPGYTAVSLFASAAATPVEFCAIG